MGNLKNKIKQLFIASRPVSWVNTAYPFAAGYIMTMRSIDVTLIVGTIFFLIPYNLLMYGVNDVFDYESDIRNPRKGGVEGAVLPRSIHRFILLAAFGLSAPFAVYLALNSNGAVGVMTLLAVLFFVLAYSVPKLRFKERAFIDSFTSSCHFVGPLLYALTFTTISESSVYILAAFFLWGMASHAFGAVQDITADRQAQIGSIATTIGARSTVRLAAGLYGLSALILTRFGFLGLIVALTELLYVAMVWPYRSISDSDAEQSNIGWKRFIKLNMLAGFVVTMVLVYVYAMTGSGS